MAQAADTSFDDWGHSVAGFVTDYMIFVVCHVLGFAALNKRRSASSDYSENVFYALALFLALAGVAFLFGGFAHTYIYVVASTGEPLGKTWGAMHMEWLFPWLAAVAISPASALANLNIMLSGVGRTGWLRPLLLLGAVLGVVEIVLLTDETWLRTSGLLSMLTYVAVSLTAAVWAGVLAVRGRAGMALFSVANGVILAGWLVVAGSPSGCGQYSDPNSSCPFPAEFNQNAIFHTFFIVGLILEHLAVASFEEAAVKAPMIAVNGMVIGTEEGK